MQPPVIANPANPTGQPPTDQRRIALSRHEIMERIEWLGRLQENNDFGRFMEIAQRRLDVTQAKASDIDNLDGAKRDAYAQAHFELKYFVEWVGKEMERLRAAVRETDERARKLV